MHSIMAHHYIRPADASSFLGVPETLERIRAAFPRVEISRGKAQLAALERIVLSHDRLDPSIRDPRELDLVPFERLCRRVLTGHFVSIPAVEDPADAEDWLSFEVSDGEPLFLAYASGEQEDLTEPIRDRLAKVLGYVVSDWRDDEAARGV